MESGTYNSKVPLSNIGIKLSKSANFNLNEAALMQNALLRKEGTLGIGGALLVKTGDHTGRSPKYKYVVVSDETHDSIWWEKNKKLSSDSFNLLYKDVLEHVQGKDLFVQDLYACSDPEFRLNVRVISELAWHGLFMRHLLRRPTGQDLNTFSPEFTIINCPSFEASPNRHETRSNTVIAINFEKKLVIIVGTAYAGENKKAVFTLLNYLLPKKGVMPMHCSANHALGNENDVAIFFGLSGTGKTTLSQDPRRVLIGDDEHGWSDDGIFNFEGGCYAKTINLSADAEPEIYATIDKFSTVVENMVYDPESLKLDFKDDSLTPNMRAAYPLESISNRSQWSRGGKAKNIIFLTCDAFGVLPPVAKLSHEQAIYHFLLGFTSKAAGTERGVIEPEPTFSECFAAPFLPLKPQIYGNLLRKKISKEKSRCWLVNTGWTGGPYGVGTRIPIRDTRTIVTAILEDDLSNVKFRVDENFRFEVPLEISGIDPKLLIPKETWPSDSDYDKQAGKLVKLFISNFQKYKDVVDKNILSEAL